MGKYKLSQFNLYADNDGYFLIRNTLHNSVVRIDKNLFNKLKSSLNKPYYAEEVEKLKKCKIVVPESMNEFLEWKKGFDKLTDEKILRISFAPTFSCNFKCVYCIQEGNFIERPTMKDSLVDDAFIFCDKVIKGEKIKRATLTFYGGEPLLNFPTCLKILNGYKDFIKRNKLSEEGIHMDTNAYLLNLIKIKLLKNSGLRYVLVTLDGTKGVHNRRRLCPKNRNTFDKIFKNIISLAKSGTFVSIFTPVDAENVDELIPLIDFLDKKIGLEKKNITLYFRTVENNDVFKERLSKVLYGKEKFLNKKIVTAFVYARKRGFNYMTRASSYQCSRFMRYNLIVGPMGEIYKCAGTAGLKKQIIGSIYDDIGEVLKNVDKYISVNGLTKKCETCEILPHCFGGCQFQSIMKTGKSGSMICEKESLLTLYKEQLKNNIS